MPISPLRPALGKDGDVRLTGGDDFDGGAGSHTVAADRIDSVAEECESATS